jgi:ribosomal protein S27E
MEQPEVSTTNQEEIKCNNCGAKLNFSPGTEMLKCPYCEAENEIEASEEHIEEIDLESFLSNLEDSAEVEQVVTVSCNSCNAKTTFDPNIVSDECDFCGNPIAVKEGTKSDLIKPKSLLPFKVEQGEAFKLYSGWLSGLWWAPNDLKKYARQKEKLVGIYIPYWTYDSDTYSRYTGQRGTNYQTTETYTTTVNGKSTTGTRTVTKIRWSFVSGHVSRAFDDVLVLASTSLPKKYADKLDPWDLENLVSFDPKFLSGFKAESYQVDIKDGFTEAKDIMEVTIRRDVKYHIGGDHQRITTLDTSHSSVTFKHTLLPIWISAYKYKTKSYRFMVNGRTGEVQGERPYSWIKIGLAILGVLALVAAVIIIYNYNAA